MTPTPHIPGAEIADARLREIIDGCSGVTPGPWTAIIEHIGIANPDRTAYVKSADALVVAMTKPGVVENRYALTADYIARLDPATVKAMATELLAAREALARIVPEGAAERLRERKGYVLELLRTKAASLEAANSIAQWIWDADNALAASPAVNVPPQVNEAVVPLVMAAFMEGFGCAAEWDQGKCYPEFAADVWPHSQAHADWLAAVTASPGTTAGASEVALSDIAAERERQKSVEGWTTEHDDGHVDSELGRAAAAYALFAASPKRFTALARAVRDMIPSVWPWDAGWWKPSDKNRRNLVKAGALIVAEIERLDRQALGDRS